jgi:hypothetical protein
MDTDKLRELRRALTEAETIRDTIGEMRSMDAAKVHALFVRACENVEILRRAYIEARDGTR